MGIEFNPINKGNTTGQVYRMTDPVAMPEEIKFDFSKSNNVNNTSGIEANHRFKQIVLDDAFRGLRGVPKDIDRYIYGMTYVDMEIPTNEVNNARLALQQEGDEAKARAEYFGTNNSQFNNLQPFNEYLITLEQEMA